MAAPHQNDSLIATLKSLELAVKTLASHIEKQNKAAAVTSGSAATVTSGGAALAARQPRATFWERLGGADDDSTPERRAQASRRGKEQVGIGAAIGVGQFAAQTATASFNPLLTKGERESQIASGAGSLIGGGIGGLAGAATGNPLLAYAGMQVGAQAGSAIGSLFGQKGESIDKEAVGGLGDLRELAKAGYNVDDALKQRAGFERAAAERGFEFDTKAAAAVGAAGPGDGNNTGARDAGIAALLAVAVPVIGPIAASIFAIARVVERNGNSMQKQHPDQ